MACRLNLTALVLAIPLLAGIAPCSHAQVLADPTRPPGNVESGPAGSNNESGLQSIIRPAKDKPRALINGEVVALGGKVGESRLVAINTDSVVLMDTAGNRETLTLTPGISKTPAKHKPTAPR
jgi:hypothetical protein